MLIEVRTSLGALRGRQTGASATFLGIPYAQPPVGALRWRSPRPPTPWDGVREALAPPPRAFQLPFPSTLARGDIPGEMSEDMLYLNIYTPAPDGRRRPVLVYIHGGGYTVGSANDFDPSPFVVRHDVVVVSINYRLGMLGFLDLSRFGEEFRGSVSLGFQDQIAALRLVRQEIEHFGGDPDRITICGVSAGAGSVLALMGAPAAKGLFCRAMAFSPGEIARSPPDSLPQIAAALSTDDDAAFRDLQTMTASEVFELQKKIGMSGVTGVDGDVIVAPIEEAIRRDVNVVPLIVGTCRNEGTMLVPSIEEYDLPGLEATLSSIKHTISAGDPARYTAFLDAALAGSDARARMVRFWYDYFRAPTVRAAQACAALERPAWVYNFDVATDHPFGPTHASDMAFTFSLFDAWPEGEVLGFHPNTETNRRIAVTWSGAIARFVRDGDPNGPGLPDWPRWSRERRASLSVRDASAVVFDDDSAAAIEAYGA